MNEKALSQLRVEPDIVVAVFLHDFGLDVLRTPASGALSETVLGLADQSSILLFCSVFRTLDYVRVRVVTEHETHLVVGPPVKLGGDRKVRVASQQDVLETGFSAQRDRLVVKRYHSFVRCLLPLRLRKKRGSCVIADETSSA
jgi:hypothetical protein